MARWTADDIPDQTGRTAVVTGANSGLGLRSSEALARAGARVLLACRDERKGGQALDAVRAVATGAEPELVRLDLADLGSVREAATAIGDLTERIDVLLDNAGVMAIPERRTVDGFEAQLGTNHLGHFALTGLLLGRLLTADAPRVVVTSSQAHRIGRMRWDDLNWSRGYSKWAAYGQSKLANLLFAFELDRRARAAGTSLVAVAAHPGYAATHLQERGPAMAGSRVMLGGMHLANRVFAQTDAMGALPQLHAATAPGVSGGEYHGPGGLFENRGYPERVRATRAAYDEDAARRLWQESERLTGVTYDWSAAPASRA